MLRVVLGIIAILTLAGAADAQNPRTLHSPTAARTMRPSIFVQNQGQAPKNVLFQAKGAGFEANFSRDSFVLRLFGAKPEAATDSASAAATGLLKGVPPSPQRVSVTEQRISFAGASPNARIEALDPLPGKMSFFVGNDSKRWVRDSPPTPGCVTRTSTRGLTCFFTPIRAHSSTILWWRAAPTRAPSACEWKTAVPYTSLGMACCKSARVPKLYYTVPCFTRTGLG